ncbi:MAG: HAMP domain-containing histidine kinase [Kordiimonadaceae bacterium]|jgi:signal transduction histidine kinase|nr:HAMP domain-containing histidine kinase [Kordiimonadaceae bacterium]MBT6036583.1 HAMP domain-containing histidine kinase [Kordiimonadaceae bacterium]MBT6328690.1 HAMP domain-containing histidine kinase [Kordiimonadaceae bacterium]
MTINVSRQIFTLAALTAILTFILDLSLPLGVAGGIPYVAMVLLGIWFPTKRHVIVLAIIGSLLTITGYFLSSAASDIWIVFTNRFLSILMIWITAIIVSLSKETENKLILARKEAVDALEVAKRANSASQAKSDFLATMSHEIRTPLNAIIGFAEALEMGIGADNKDDRNERLNIIASSGRQLNNLISDILDFSKVEAGKLDLNIQPVLPSNVFEHCLPTIQQLTESNNISFQGIKKSNTQIFADPVRLEQIIINFISNSVKYNKPDGSIEFGCYLVPNNHLRIYVKDAGIGIPKEKEELIFSPFDRINHIGSGVGGIGLGLAICKKLTEAMNGTIGYETTLGKGSTFWIEFPTYSS